MAVGERVGGEVVVDARGGRGGAVAAASAAPVQAPPRSHARREPEAAKHCEGSGVRCEEDGGAAVWLGAHRSATASNRAAQRKQLRGCAPSSAPLCGALRRAAHRCPVIPACAHLASHVCCVCGGFDGEEKEQKE